MIKVLIADDHPLVREGLKKTLKEESSIEVVCEAKNGIEVLDLIDKYDLDVVVMDLSMPEKNGLEVLSELRLKKPRLPVLILSMHPEDRFAVRALRGGASGYLTKDSAPQDLVNAIFKINAGGKFVTPTVAEKLAIDIDPNMGKPPHEVLSDRELEVLILLAQGMPAKDISEKVCISLSTVNTYRVRILEKLDLKTNIELTHYAIRNRLIDPTF